TRPGLWGTFPTCRCWARWKRAPRSPISTIRSPRERTIVDPVESTVGERKVAGVAQAQRGANLVPFEFTVSIGDRLHRRLAILSNRSQEANILQANCGGVPCFLASPDAPARVYHFLAGASDEEAASLACRAKKGGVSYTCRAFHLPGTSTTTEQHASSTGTVFRRRTDTHGAPDTRRRGRP